MANSREPLAIVGEVVYNVPPLAAAEATQLFLERARAVNPKVTFTASDKATVARICARLDGIPLAIELAAARVSLLSLEQIDARLDDRFRLLVGGDREALPRQKTLRALIDWSYDLLSEEERGLLRQLSVFSSGWTLEAIETICPDLDILTLMTELVNKSLVTKVEDMGAARFQLLETIRHYAREKLVEAGESEAAQASHAAYFRQLAERAGPKLATADSPRWLETLEAEHDNLRAAFEWWVERSAEDALRIVKALTYYWSLRGNQGEGRAWAEAAIAKVEALPGLEGEAALERKSLVAHVLLTLTMLAVMQGDNDYAEGVSEKCAALAREIGDKTLLAQVLTYTCSGRLVVGDSRGVEELMAEALSAARESGDAVALGMALSLSAEILMLLDKDQETMRAYSEEGIALLEQSGNLWSLSIVLLDMGMTAKFKGRHDESRTRFAALEPLLRQLGDRHRLNLIRSEYGHMERYGGRIEAAEQVYRETIVEWRRLGHRAAVAHQLESFAFIARAQERPERAARLLGAAELLREKISIQMSPSERVEYEAEVEKLRQALDEARFNAHWAAGRTLSTDAAIAYALEQDEPLTTTG